MNAAALAAWRARAVTAGPGVALASGVGLAAWLVERGFIATAGRAPVEALVLAILLGAALRGAWTPGARFDPGLAVASGLLLELSIVLLGAGADLRQFAQVGVVLGGAIAATVLLALITGFAIGRLVGLTRTHAVLVACGNAICGNSAIAAVAPVIGARRDEVASAIAYTAVLGVVVILGLPHLAPLFRLDDYQYGVLAGLTVYAVPQVIAAAYPVSVLAGQTATLVKLARVLLLGPLVFALSVARRRRAGAGTRDAEGHPPYVPWFVMGFGAAALLRTGGLIRPADGDVARDVARLLTLLAMAALGLGVDLRAVRHVGPRVAAAVTGSLVVMVVAALFLVHALPRAG
ncbi:MAG: YeiH family protein [Gemmatimonadales bacterium]